MTHLEGEVILIRAQKGVMLFPTAPVKWDPGRIIGKNKNVITLQKLQHGNQSL